jgi:hypothetical protein
MISLWLLFAPANSTFEKQLLLAEYKICYIYIHYQLHCRHTFTVMQLQHVTGLWP